MPQAELYLQDALAAYDLGGRVIDCKRHGSGHVNDTFRVRIQPEEGPSYRVILQRASSVAFHNSKQLMSNVVGVTSFLHDKIAAAGGDPERESMTIIPTREGKSFYTDEMGDAWRMYIFIEDTFCPQSAESAELFSASARAFGRFQRMLADYPAETLYETIPHFHDTEDRLAKLKLVASIDPMGRAGGVQPELDFILAREADCSVALQAQREGKLPLRVTHNDTKLNNVLFDRATGEGICVIDLDTVMPGLSINDFGDSIRFGANHADEDERDLSKVNLDLELYEAYTQGFLAEAGSTLTPAELDYLPWGAKLMTLECGIRFLTDHLDGDHYFSIHRPNQNLDRCRTQLKLVADMERHWAQLCAIVDKYR